MDFPISVSVKTRALVGRRAARSVAGTVTAAGVGAARGRLRVNHVEVEEDWQEVERHEEGGRGEKRSRAGPAARRQARSPEREAAVQNMAEPQGLNVWTRVFNMVVLLVLIW